MSRSRRLAERVPLVRRKNKLHLKGVKATASTEPDILGRICPPDEWLETVFAAIPRLQQMHAWWGNENDRHRWAVYGYTGYWVPPWLTLQIHRCADCGKAWYVAHFSAKRCETCEHRHQQLRIRASNERMIARRARRRAAGREDMACEDCHQPMSGGRLRRYCNAAHRQAAYRERQQSLLAD